MSRVSRVLSATVPVLLVSVAVETRAQPSSAPPPAVAHDGQSVKNDVSAPLGAIRPTPPAPGPTRRALRPTLSSGHAHGPHLTPARGLDPALQTVSIASAPMPPSVSVEGIRNVDFVLPPDTNGDVGPNHYVQWVNLSFAVFSKTGSLLYGPAAGNTLWAGLVANSYR